MLEVRRTVALSAALLAPTLVACVAAQETTMAGQEATAPTAPIVAPSFAPVAEAMADAIEVEMERHDLPALSIAVVDGDEIVWADAFGTVATSPGSSQRRSADLDTVYRVGSVSKLFTEIAIMQLVESGDVDLDAPLTEYLPELAPANPFGEPITLRQIMTHRSGLVREPPVGHYFDDTEPSLAETVASLNRTGLVNEPGDLERYSNAAIAVAGLVVERISGSPFATAVRERVLDPLAMDSSAFEPTPAVREQLADALMWGIDGRELTAPTFALGMAPAGSMYATVTDLSRFMIALIAGGEGENGRLLQPRTLEQMWTPQYPGAGFGIGFGLGELDGRRWVGHGGAIYGFATRLMVMPDDGLGVVVTTTRDFANPVANNLAAATLRAALAVRAGAAIAAYEPTPPLMEGLAAAVAGRDRVAADGTVIPRAADTPPPAPENLRGLIGEYGWDHDVLFVLERDGELHVLIEWFDLAPLEHLGGDRFRFGPDAMLYPLEMLVFERDEDGNGTAAILGMPPDGDTSTGDWGVRFERRATGTPAGETFKIEPVRPVSELRAEAQAASPPEEAPPAGGFREPELVEITGLDPTIKLDIRYAGTNNFMDSVFYEQPRAFLQRPAAEALVRVHRALADEGYGLLIHDAYRPWYVTKMFWDATPEAQKQFVANPANGSRHNRGAAVDLTLYDLATGDAVQMVGGYDEFTERSYPDYPGGTSRQRWLRELLREYMEAQGFAVYEVEWWHFDHDDWRLYPILDLTFDEIRGAR